MVPYHRFLLTVMLLPQSNESRQRILEEHNCSGLNYNKIKSLSIDLSHLDNAPESLKKFWRSEDSDGYPESDALYFASEQEIDDLFIFINGKSDDEILRCMLSIASNEGQYNFLMSLLKTNLPLDKILEHFNNRYSRDYEEKVIEKFYHYFSKYSSISSFHYNKWLNIVSDRLRYLLRIADNESLYVLLDELGVECDLDLKTVSSRIISRGLRHFDNLSRSGHKEALREAREWGKIILAAGRDYEKSKKGNISDFLGEFQISLVEADSSLIESNDDEGE